MAARREVALFLLATQFLTRVPVSSTTDFQPRSLGQSLRYFPLVGGLVGLISVGAFWLFSRWLPVAVAVGLMLAVQLLVTGAFHEDGFADTCDGLGGGNTPERTLAIMKDSRIGAFGAIGLVMLLGLKWSALVALTSGAFALVVVAAQVVSRWCAIGLVWALRYARADAEGKSASFDGALAGRQWLLSGLIGAIPVAIMLLWSATDLSRSLALAACVSFGMASATAFLAAAYLHRRIGGYTGDCLGAGKRVAQPDRSCPGLGDRV